MPLTSTMNMSLRPSLRSPLAPKKGKAHTSARSPARRLACSALASDPESTMHAIRIAAAVPTTYALVSVNEYITHRWYQHEELNAYAWARKFAQTFLDRPKLPGGGHVEHHAETLDDMSLRTDAKWLASEPCAVLEGKTYRGTAFEYDIVAMMIAQMFVTCPWVLCGVLGLNFAEASAFIVSATVTHGLIWNALHPAMHGLPDVPIAEGLPSSWLKGLRGSAYFNWLYANHQGHHVLSGRCNYNVCAPLVDHVLGTYVPESEWGPKAKTSNGDESRPQYDATEYARALAAASTVKVPVSAN